MTQKRHICFVARELKGLLTPLYGQFDFQSYEGLIIYPRLFQLSFSINYTLI